MALSIVSCCPTGFRFGRDAQRGIAAYATRNPSWRLFYVEDIAYRTLPRFLRDFRPDGALTMVDDSAVAMTLSRARLPIVNLALVPGCPLPQVAIDEAKIGAIAARHLQACGYPHYACVGMEGVFSRLREASFKEAMAVRRQPVEFLRLPFARKNQATLTLLTRWLQRVPKPIAILLVSDVLAAVLSIAVEAAGLAIPDDVAVLACDNDELFCHRIRPSVSSIELPSERIGFEGAALLDRMMAGIPAPREPQLLPPGAVVSRASSRTRPDEDPLVLLAVRQLDDRLDQDLSIKRLAHLLEVRRGVLERRFRAALRMTPAEALRTLRIARAVRLIRDTTLPLAAIARDAGFSSQPRLSECIRQATGLTPTRLRSDGGAARLSGASERLMRMVERRET